jgi:tetratricopeptide (TPR) repeat protein/O-antigen ligase
MCVAWFIKWVEEYPGGRSTNKNVNGTGMKERSRFLRFIIDTPCVLLVLLFLISYAFSTIISIFPRISFMGSYSRLQGLYTFIAYGVIFFILINTIEKREQVERFFKIIIFTSVPISLYGILQHYQLDPLTWSTTIGERITGANMGNPIFVAAYLIMVVPITISMLIKSFVARNQEKDSRSVLWLTILLYCIIVILQVACILFTQSRGPWLGLFGAFFIYFLGTLIFVAGKDRTDFKFGIKDALKASLFALGGIITGLLPAYLYCFIKKKGFRWLWLGFVFQTIILAALLFTLNLPNTPLKQILKIPYVSRLGELSYKAESGTTRVRILIWDGTIDLIRSNPLRMIIGYGPESMKHVWDPHSPAELAHHESKSAAPDRAHNEAFDRIVTTGFIGFFLYMTLMGSIFYFGFKWLDLINTKAQKVFFFIVTILGSILGMLLPRFIQGTFSFAGVGLSFGFIIAISIYLMAAPFMMRNSRRNSEQCWKHFLILGLLAGIAAHFIEIHFGIAIASTRLYFFAYSAVIVALGMKEFLQVSLVHNQADAPVRTTEKLHKKGKAHHSTKKRLNQQVKTKDLQKPASRYLPLRPLLVYTLLTGLIMSTIVFSFITNQQSETDTFSIIWLSLVGRNHTFGTLILLIVTYLVGGILVLESVWHSSHETGKKGDFLGSIGVYTVTNLFIFVIYSFIQSSYLKPGMDVSGIILFYFIFVLSLGLAATFFLMPPFKVLPSVFWKKKALWLYALLFFAAFWTISVSNISPVKADIYLKLGQAHEKNYRWNEGARLVTRAIDTEPDEETFYLNLGRILFGKANSSNDLNEKNAIFEKILETMKRAHSLNPMNTDHIANLGLLYLRWAEFDPTPENRRNKLSISNSYFQKALEKSPKKTIIINNFARVLSAEGNFNEAISKLNYSLSLDKTFAGTYIALGDIYGMYGRPREALQAYEKAVEYDQLNANAMSMLGLMYFKEGRLKESLELTRKAVELWPNLMKAQSLLGLIYFKLGRFQEAIDTNLKVLAMRPSDIGAHRNLVILYDKIGRRDYAIKHLESVIQYAPAQEKQQLEQVLQRMKTGKSLAPQGS